MNRLFSLLLAAFFAMLLAGCGYKLTSVNLEKVEVGMTEQQVQTILGKPTTIETSSMLGIGGTVYRYKSGGTEVTIVFVDGKVLSKSGSFK